MTTDTILQYWNGKAAALALKRFDVQPQYDGLFVVWVVGMIQSGECRSWLRPPLDECRLFKNANNVRITGEIILA
jgi:hypothetical protein